MPPDDNSPLSQFRRALDLIQSGQWRILWREKAFQWLRERRQYTNFDLDCCLSKLQENPVLREAALAAFWSTYLANEVPPALSELQVERVKKILDYSSLPSPTAENIRDLAFVKFHLAGLLAICFIRPDCPIIETPSAVEILEKALEAYRLAEPPAIDIDDPPAWGKRCLDEDLFAFSLELVVGIVRTELSLFRAEQRKYETALSLITEGAWSMCATTIEDIEDDVDFKPYLPHSGYQFDIQEAANIFEEVKKHARDIENWEYIKVYCEVLKYLSLHGLYDFLSDIRDANGEIFAANEYWGKAITFAEDQMRIVPFSRYILTRDAIQWTETRERLKSDFFPDTWDELTEETQKILVGAEIDWMDKRLDDMVKAIRQMLELALPSVFRTLEPCIRPESDKLLPLTLMINNLSRNRIVKAEIDGLKTGKEDKDWAKDELPTFLKEVRNTRNYFKQHHLPSKAPHRDEYLAKAIVIHSKLLGIGCKGVLPRLLKIKRARHSKE